MQGLRDDLLLNSQRMRWVWLSRLRPVLMLVPRALDYGLYLSMRLSVIGNWRRIEFVDQIILVQVLLS
jgi:hypothetical protein